MACRSRQDRGRGYLRAANGPLADLFHALADSAWLPWIGRSSPRALVLVGLSLMLGLFTQAGWGALALLALFYLSNLPTHGAPSREPRATICSSTRTWWRPPPSRSSWPFAPDASPASTCCSRDRADGRPAEASSPHEPDARAAGARPSQLPEGGGRDAGPRRPRRGGGMKGPVHGGPVRIGFVGLGAQGGYCSRTPIRAYAHVVALCDINPAQLAKADESSRRRASRRPSTTPSGRRCSRRRSSRPS